MTDSGITWRHAAGVGVVILLLCYGVLRWTTAHGHGLPHMSWFLLVTMVLLSIAVLAAGWEVRSYLQGTSVRPPSPQKARRALVAAQAAVLAGAIFAGWFGAFALIELGRLDASSALSRMIQAIVLCVASIGAVVVGLVVQSWCRIPKDQDDDPPEGGSLRA
ncbi:hypothetical protein GCM10011492_16790 [Flexivirga endophytica]|uniref:DUF3180 domain-containing protein n=1 Tax=Flexivirga endophytica TaxID=1849103 RepID=A0A916WT32_9MICO|nr:DUF3180 domain-containing protein [Flexivirga endophytica]GGB27124.1 hypothetical protein GCM10011492_16790 [Flexivirga endophytica]GHB55617.1 hypothetical protein GCM10008112_26100 [Flexivirga endophytica]